MKPLPLKKRLIVFCLIFSLAFGVPSRSARADLFGGDVAVLTQILVQAIQQVVKLQQIIGTARDTLSILEEMNRGVKEVLRLAETAHVPIPPGIYAQAKSIDQAIKEARRVYGEITDRSPPHTRTHYQSGVEGLSLSQDAFDYSTFLDEQGERVKRAAIVASQASATRLTAETLGVLLHSMSHSNRLQAKQLEISSTNRIESSAKESARFDSFLSTHQHIEETLKTPSMSSLNEIQF